MVQTSESLLKFDCRLLQLSTDFDWGNYSFFISDDRVLLYEGMVFVLYVSDFCHAARKVDGFFEY